METRVSPLDRIFRSGSMSLSAEIARHILQLDFSAADHARYIELSEKVQDGSPTDSEKAELKELLIANDMLAILQSRARAALKRQSPAA
jgi:hypothetical protein